MHIYIDIYIRNLKKYTQRIHISFFYFSTYSARGGHRNFISIYIYRYMQVGMPGRCLCIYLCIQVSICICVSICIYLCIFLCIYVSRYLCHMSFWNVFFFSPVVPPAHCVNNLFVSFILEMTFPVLRIGKHICGYRPFHQPGTAMIAAWEIIDKLVPATVTIVLLTSNKCSLAA